MPLLPTELARVENNQLLLRPDAARLTWTLDDLPAADGHALRVRFACGVKALADPAESQMLRDVLMGGRRAVTLDDVNRHFAPTLRTAAVGVADDKGVEAWLTGEDKDEFESTLRTAAEKLAFACGLEILGPFQVDLESPSYEQKRLRDLQRALAEQEAAGRVEHFNRAADLLKRFEDAREKAPDLTPGALLSRLSPVDQGATLQTLLLASAKRQQANDLWAVGGEYLVRVDARSGSGTPAVELFPLPPTLGPLRSVQPASIDGQRVLLVGARSGFFLVRPDDPTHPEAYPDHGVQSQLGFSRVVFHNRERGFAACHGEAGLVRWTYAHTNGPSEVLRPERFGGPAAGTPPAPPTSDGPPPLPSHVPPPPQVPPLPPAYGAPAYGGSIQTSFQGSYQGSAVVPSRPSGPRNLQVVDDRRLLLTVGPALWVLDGDEATEVGPAASQADVAAVVLDGRLVHLVHEDGTIATLDAATRSTVGTRRRPMRVRAAGAVPWLGSTRVLLAGDDGPVQCVGVDDSLVTEYVSTHRGLRVLTGSADLVVGVTADRQRLVLWHTWDGRAPIGEVYVTARTKHRIADVEFG
jgi:hypothetical protein